MNTKRLTTTSLMLALTLILGLTPLGFLPLPFLSIDVTLMCLPVIIGTILLGWRPGLLLGLTFGLTSLYKALSAPSPLVAALVSYPWALYPSIFVPRLLIPLLTWGAYRLTQKLPQALGLGITAAVGSLTNTVFFLGMLFALGATPIAESLGISVRAVGIMLATVVGTNGVPEAIVAVMLCVPITIALQKVLGKEKL